MRAKFRCDSVTDFGGSKKAKLTAITNGSEENSDFNKYTPSAELEIHICNPNALDYFKPDEEYYLNFSKAEKGDIS
jgi:hypothetical protein